MTIPTRSQTKHSNLFLCSIRLCIGRPLVTAGLYFWKEMLSVSGKRKDDDSKLSANANVSKSRKIFASSTAHDETTSAMFHDASQLQPRLGAHSTSTSNTNNSENVFLPIHLRLMSFLYEIEPGEVGDDGGIPEVQSQLELVASYLTNRPLLRNVRQAAVRHCGIHQQSQEMLLPTTRGGISPLSSSFGVVERLMKRRHVQSVQAFEERSDPYRQRILSHAQQQIKELQTKCRDECVAWESVATDRIRRLLGSSSLSLLPDPRASSPAATEESSFLDACDKMRSRLGVTQAKLGLWTLLVRDLHATVLLPDRTQATEVTRTNY